MRRMDGQRAAVRVAASYFLVSAAWIAFSDYAVRALPGPIQTIKGLLFVAVTAGFLLWYVRRQNRRLLLRQRVVDTVTALPRLLENAPNPQRGGAAMIEELARFDGCLGVELWSRIDDAGSWELTAATLEPSAGGPLEMVDLAIHRGALKRKKGELVAAKTRPVADWEAVIVRQAHIGECQFRLVFWTCFDDRFFQQLALVGQSLDIFAGWVDSDAGQRRQQIELDRLRQLIDISPLGFAVFDADAGLRWASEGTAELLELDRLPKAESGLDEGPLARRLSRSDREKLRSVIERQDLDSLETVLTDVVGDGDTDDRCVEWLLSGARLSGTYRVLGVLQDVTDREQLNAALQRSRQMYADAEKVGKLGHWRLEVPSRQLIWSRQVYRLLEVDPEDFPVSKDAFDKFIHPEDLDELEAKRQAALQGEAFDFRFRIVTAEGRQRWVHERAELRYDERGEPDEFSGTIQDVTEEVNAEQRRQRQALEIRSLAQRMTVAREEERRRIARGIHDELGQSLTGLLFGLQALKTRVAREEAAIIDALKADVSSTIEVVHRINAELRPPLLDQFGLEAAIEEQGRKFEARFGIDCLVTHNCGGRLQLPEGAAIQLFRIAQEALTNVARHAQANTVEVRLEVDEGALRLQICDDGCGFDPHVAPSSFGLQGMRERAELIEGRFQLDSDDEGTRVEVVLPDACEAEP